MSTARTHENTRKVKLRNGVWNVVTDSGQVIGSYVSYSSAEEGQREYHRWWQQLGEV